MKNELVSIVVPAYKAEKYINRCLNSLTNQTYNNVEIIVVDDGSPDKTGEMLDIWAKKDNRIKIIHKTNGGVSSARNAGIEAATGKYICFVDIDDEVKPDYVKYLHRAITEYNTDVAMCSLIAERKNGVFITEGLSKPQKINLPENIDDFANVYINGVLIPPYCKLYKKDKIIEHFNENLNYGEDELFNLNYFSKIKSLVVIPEALYIYYHNEDSLSHKKALSLIKKRIANTPLRTPLINEIFGKDSTWAKFFSSKFIIRHIFAVIEELIIEKINTKEIISILEDLVSNEYVNFALNIYPKIDKKTNLIWKCLSKKQFKKLILLRKIKMMLKA